MGERKGHPFSRSQREHALAADSELAGQISVGHLQELTGTVAPSQVVGYNRLQRQAGLAERSINFLHQATTAGDAAPTTFTAGEELESPVAKAFTDELFRSGRVIITPLEHPDKTNL